MGRKQRPGFPRPTTLKACMEALVTDVETTHILTATFTSGESTHENSRGASRRVGPGGVRIGTTKRQQFTVEFGSRLVGALHAVVRRVSVGA